MADFDEWISPRGSGDKRPCADMSEGRCRYVESPFRQMNGLGHGRNKYLAETMIL